MMTLFEIPSCAVHGDSLAIPAGGFGAGHFQYLAGGFRGWRIHPGTPIRDEPVTADRFYLWTRRGRETAALTLHTEQVAAQRCLFPLTWSTYDLSNAPIRLESLAFSPLLPRHLEEPSLPVYVIVWRVHNTSDTPIEAALMLTWACGWPDLVPRATFDFQHDKLCLTGSLGDPRGPNRMGVAVPDLHSEGIYLQGIEPWDATGDGAEVSEDFAEDGELDPVIAGDPPHGAAAWVKFTLAPGETKEIPFILVWHFPVYESSLSIGEQRYYTQFLGKRRPDNAVVWLAEQAVQTFGAETANYRYWMQQIRDWQRPILDDPTLSDEQKRRRFNGLAALLHADIVWTTDGRFTLIPGYGQTVESIKAALSESIPVAQLWPEIARQLPPDM